MSDSNQMQDDWNEMVEQMNDAVADSVEKNMQAQAALVEAWSDAFDNSVPEEDVVEEGIEGYNRAYEVWMDAAEEMFEKTTDAAEGEDVGPTEFRDIWLQSANDSFKEVMSTSAFASANGQLIETMMEMQQEIDDVTKDTVSQMGLPTRDDVEEVGNRLIELERRQHDVEQKLGDLTEGQTAAEGQLDDISQGNDAIEQKLDDEISGQLGNLTQRQNAIEEKIDDLAEGQDAVESRLADEDVDDQLDELSQRQSDVEDKLDRVLDALEDALEE